MTGESTGALKPYLLIEDSTGKEYSILLIAVTHTNKSQTESCPLVFRVYCEDILDSGNAIIEFVHGLSLKEFCDDRKTYSAVIREFEIVG